MHASARIDEHHLRFFATNGYIHRISHSSPSSTSENSTRETCRASRRVIYTRAGCDDDYPHHTGHHLYPAFSANTNTCLSHRANRQHHANENFIVRGGRYESDMDKLEYSVKHVSGTCTNSCHSGSRARMYDCSITTDCRLGISRNAHLVLDGCDVSIIGSRRRHRDNEWFV